MSEPTWTIPAFLEETVGRRAGEPALAAIRDGALTWRTWSEVLADARQFATTLRAVGIQPGDRVAQLSENRYEWIITDLALHLAGAVHVPIHTSLSGPQIAQQIADCGARLVIVSTQELLARFEGQLGDDLSIYGYDLPGERNWEALQDGAAPADSDRPAAAPEALLGKPAVAPPVPSPRPDGPPHKPPAPDDLATVIYTSGTMGRQRGVMLSQRNLATNAASVADAHASDSSQVRLCVLPLSHIYARTCDLYTWIYRGSRLVLAENRDTFGRDCQLARPTAISAVPYIYERVAQRVRAAMPTDEGQALRAVFGGRIERLSCGGAPLSAELDAWYAAGGLRVLPGYGLTESAPVVATSTKSAFRKDSVGRPLADVDVRIAPDGEILVRGPNVMLGYWNDARATQDAIRDGWLHTGDLGELDSDGFLYVRGRKKELIVLSTGKKVFPARVEAMLKSSPLVEQAAVFGDGNASLTALIVPAGKDVSQSQMQAEIERVLAHAASEEQVRRFAIADRPFSLERGEVTAKLTLCREVIARNFARQIEAMRRHAPAPVIHPTSL